MQRKYVCGQFKCTSGIAIVQSMILHIWILLCFWVLKTSDIDFLLICLLLSDKLDTATRLQARNKIFEIWQVGLSLRLKMFYSLHCVVDVFSIQYPNPVCVMCVWNRQYIFGSEYEDQKIDIFKTDFVFGDFEFFGSCQIIEQWILEWISDVTMNFLWKIIFIKTQHNWSSRPRLYWFWNLKNWKIPKQNSSSSYECVTPNKIIKQQLTCTLSWIIWSRE